jgi:FAD/FMN-containing dehydrogenase
MGTQEVIMKKIYYYLLWFFIAFAISPSTAVSKVNTVTPSSPDYDTARACLNKNFDLYPAVIYFCETAEDVSESIKKAKSLNKKVRVRSGRHSYEAFSNGNDVAIIDVSSMKNFQLSFDKKTAKIGAGMGLMDVYNMLWDKNKLTIPGGSCPNVGISGLVLGGGVSFASRKMGLTCDSVIEFEMVDANGKILNIRADNEYSDLFWACCGAGNGNFGVVTSITFITHPVNNVAIYHIDLDWNKIQESSNTWFEVLKTAPRELMMFLKFSKSGSQKSISTFGQFFGTVEDLTQILQPLLKLSTSTPSIEEVDYITAMQHWAGGSSTPPRYFKASSMYLSNPWPKSALKVIDKLFSETEITDAFLVVDSYGGAISDVKPDATAFIHRDVLGSVQTYVTWTDGEQSTKQEQWLHHLRQALDIYGQGAYFNYPDINLKNWQDQYYGKHYLRLQKLKAKYDPENLFTYEQAIKAAKF